MSKTDSRHYLPWVHALFMVMILNQRFLSTNGQRGG